MYKQIARRFLFKTCGLSVRNNSPFLTPGSYIFMLIRWITILIRGHPGSFKPSGVSSFYDLPFLIELIHIKEKPSSALIKYAFH